MLRRIDVNPSELASRVGCFSEFAREFACVDSLSISKLWDQPGKSFSRTTAVYRFKQGLQIIELVVIASSIKEYSVSLL